MIFRKLNTPCVSLNVAMGLTFLFATMLSFSACTDYEGAVDEKYEAWTEESLSSSFDVAPNSSSDVIPDEVEGSSSSSETLPLSSSSADGNGCATVPNPPRAEASWGPIEGEKTIMFFAPWTNTNAVLYVNGDSVGVMTNAKNYCGWYSLRVIPPATDFNVYFKQTVGFYYVGAEGLASDEPTIANEISLDSVAVQSDTIWVLGSQECAPAISISFPGLLGECPIRRLPVTVFDWLHGNKGDGLNGNGAPENGVSADFGSGGCSSGNAKDANGYGFMKGMVEYNLGANGVPVPANPFPESCKLTTHLADWFLPEVIAKDAQGNEYTNMTMRDIYFSMDDDGFWLAEASKENATAGNEGNRGGFFLVDDFEYLDADKAIKNPYFDKLNGSGGLHNFGFAAKIQATFEYIPGQYFEFRGDDDVWVFIDNRLAIDLGGQHAVASGAVALDTIGLRDGKMLVPGQIYDFHFFIAERHVSGSNFRMRTSMYLKVND